VSDPNGRYARHELLQVLGAEGQARIRSGSVLLVGCGALGNAAASALARAGVGRLHLTDPDRVELSNLHRQILFNEDDVADQRPKVRAAAELLTRINSEVDVIADQVRVGPDNIMALVHSADVVVDATDNLPMRYLINDACLKAGKPWIYGGVVGTTGMSLTVRPGQGPCFRCLFPEPPAPGVVPDPADVGVLGTLPVVVGSLEATEALKLLVGASGQQAGLVCVDLWTNQLQRIPVQPDPGCPACALGRYDFLPDS